jgi:hypothetical protein
MLDVTYWKQPSDISSHWIYAEPTRCLLLLVASYSAYNGVVFASDAIRSTLNVLFGLRGLVLGLALGVLFLAGLLPRLETSHVTDRLDKSALRGVELAGSFAKRSISNRIGMRMCVIADELGCVVRRHYDYELDE